MNDEQDEYGTLPDVVPHVRFGGRPADPGWGAAYPRKLLPLSFFVCCII
jgi:hypothetical protein